MGCPKIRSPFPLGWLANEAMDKVRKRVREGLESRQKKEALFKHNDLLWLG
jgi:hypothetical protein